MGDDGVVGGSRVTVDGFRGVEGSCIDGAFGEVAGLLKYVTVGFFRRVPRDEGGSDAE